MKLKAIAAVAVLMTSCTPLMAQETPCWEREAFLINMIIPHEGENVGYGLNRDGRMLEVWTRPDGQWLLTAVTGDMVTCLITYGNAWQDGYRVPPGEQG